MFRGAVLFFLGGILTALVIDSINSLWYLLPLILLIFSIFIWHKPYVYLILGFSCGFAWLLVNLTTYTNHQLPKSLENQPIKIQGRVVSIPEYQDHLLSFSVKAPYKLKLDWYLYPSPIKAESKKNATAIPQKNSLPEINPGEKWQFTVKLKRPHSLMNPGSFDYLSWALEEDIQASGYIISAKKIAASSWHNLDDQLRNYLKNKINFILGGHDLANFIAALTIGVRENITAEQWQILQNTGTNHLIAIAGLHIGFISGLVFFLTSFLWRRLPRLPLLIATPRISASFSLLAAWMYATLAGFSIPTIRAVIMISIFMGYIIIRKIVLPWSAWCLALFVTLAFNPLSVLSAGFWLSFSAVALIIFVASGKVGSSNRWWRLGKIQIALAMGLLPITLLFFHNGSLIAPVANTIAIPIIGFLTVPLSVFGVLTSIFSVTLAKPILLAALLSMQLTWKILTYLAHQPGFSYPISIQFWQAISMLFSVILLLLPKGLPCKSLAIIFMLPLILLKSPDPKYAQVYLTVLDVGQGLSAVIKTQKHLLIYDTGARYSESYDMGQAVVVPYLQYYHIKSIDKIIISHGDNDHIGGLHSLLLSYPTTDILTSVLKRIPNSLECLAGQRWQWDGVNFEILYPDNQHLGLDNNSSCVLRITTGNHQVLLTGDIEKLTENYLLEKNKDKLTATILVAPHHGSKTSSTKNFVNAVNPNFVIFSTGYLNRFHFPNQQTISRYQQLGVKLTNTAYTGAVQFVIGPTGKISAPNLYCYKMNFKYLRGCSDL